MFKDEVKRGQLAAGRRFAMGRHGRYYPDHNNAACLLYSASLKYSKSDSVERFAGWSKHRLLWSAVCTIVI
jgi:hypothetical protein